MWIIVNKRYFVIFLDNFTHKSIKPQKRKERGSSKWKEVKRKPDKINELIIITTVDLNEGADNIY